MASMDSMKIGNIIEPVNTTMKIENLIESVDTTTQRNTTEGPATMGPSAYGIPSTEGAFSAPATREHPGSDFTQIRNILSPMDKQHSDTNADFSQPPLRPTDAPEAPRPEQAKAYDYNRYGEGTKLREYLTARKRLFVSSSQAERGQDGRKKVTRYQRPAAIWNKAVELSEHDERLNGLTFERAMANAERYNRNPPEYKSDGE
jgi:hypothetical protein